MEEKNNNMANIRKQKPENVISPSVLDGKRKELLDKLSELAGNADGNYGPFFMEKLHARLDLVVNNFNEEVESLLKTSFNKWRMENEQLRELLKNKLNSPKKKPKRKAQKKSDAPNFLKDIEFGPIRNK